MIVIPLRVPGLVAADFSFRLYRGLDAISAAGVDVSQLHVGGDYLVTGLPSARNGSIYTLTWSYGGMTQSTTFPEQKAFIVLPLRTPGVVIADLQLQWYKDGAPESFTSSLTELGTATGEYRLELPVGSANAGEWSVTWDYSGTTQAFGFDVELAAGAGWSALAQAVEDRILGAFLLAAAIEPALELQYGGSNRKEWSVKAEVQYFRGSHRRGTPGRLASSDTTLERSPGFIVITLLMSPETGQDELGEIIDAIRPAFETRFAQDGLEFEVPPHPYDPYRSGAHWLAVIEYQYYVNAIVSLTA